MVVSFQRILVSILLCTLSLPSSRATPLRQTATTTKAGALDDELKGAIRNAPKADQHPDSDYVRLLDLGKVTVQPDGTVVGEFRETYKLFNERARRLAEVSLPYNSSYQSVKVLKARTIKKNGDVLEVKPSDFRVSSPFNDYLMYDDAVAVGFSMPGIEDDCVIDYTFQMTTLPVLMPGQFWTYWGFSDTSPVVISKYTLTLPANKAMQFKVYNDGSLQAQLTQQGGKKTYTWERKTISPIQREPAMPGMDEVRIWMEGSSLTSWQDVSGWFWRLAESQVNSNREIDSTVKQLTANRTTPEAKARAIYDWVANKTRYVGLEFGLSAFKPHLASDVHKNLYGDCKDKAILLICMLGKAGIKAHPVLLKAGDQRTVSKGLPTLNAFNHCIAWSEIGGKEYWLDATAETCAFGDIPDGDRGCEGFIVREGKGEFKVIPPYRPDENGMRLKSAITLNADGSATAEIDCEMLGGIAQQIRATLRSVPPIKYRDLVTALSQKFLAGGKLEDYSLPDGLNKEGVFKLHIRASISDFAEKTGSLMLIPLTLGSSQGAQQQPFTKESRLYPIVQTYIARHSVEISVSLPKGFSVVDLPNDMNLNSPIQSYQRTTRKSDDGKTVLFTELEEEKSGRIPASDYKQVQSFFTTLSKQNKARLILKEEKP